MVSNELLMHIIEQEYPHSDLFKNFWVGTLTDEETYELIRDAEILDWKVEGVPQPTQSELQALCAKPKYQLWEAQRVKKIELLEANDAELARGVTSNGNTFDLSMLRNQFDIMAMASAVQIGLPTTTRPKLSTLAGPRVELTDKEVVDLATSAHDQVSTTANHLGDKLEAVAAATTAAEVEAITW